MYNRKKKKTVLTTYSFLFLIYCCILISLSNYDTPTNVITVLVAKTSFLNCSQEPTFQFPKYFIIYVIKKHYLFFLKTLRNSLNLSHKPEQNLFHVFLESVDLLGFSCATMSRGYTE